MLRDALEDGVLDKTERNTLQNYSVSMGISDEEAMRLLKQESRVPANNVSSNHPDFCPHCGESIADLSRVA